MTGDECLMCTALPRPSHHCSACHCLHSMPRCCAKWGWWGPSCLALIYPCNWPRCHQQRLSACCNAVWVWPEGECRYWRGLGTEESPEEIQCWWESSQSAISEASSCIFWCWVQTWQTRPRRLRCQAAACQDGLPDVVVGIFQVKCDQQGGGLFLKAVPDVCCHSGWIDPGLSVRTVGTHTWWEDTFNTAGESSGCYLFRVLPITFCTTMILWPLRHLWSLAGLGTGPIKASVYTSSTFPTVETVVVEICQLGYGVVWEMLVVINLDSVRTRWAIFAWPDGLCNPSDSDGLWSTCRMTYVIKLTK